MSVKIYNFSFVRDLPEMFETDAGGMSVGSLFDHLESEYSSEIKKTMLTDGKPAESYRILLNGSIISDLDTPIPDESKIFLSMVVLGG